MGMKCMVDGSKGHSHFVLEFIIIAIYTQCLSCVSCWTFKVGLKLRTM